MTVSSLRASVTKRVCGQRAVSHPPACGEYFQYPGALSPTPAVLFALSLARGVPGLMKPAPEQADAGDAFALLNYAALIGERG